MMKAEEIFYIFSEHKTELDDRGVENLAIFGSVARNDSSEASDVDILVEFNKPVGLFEFIGLKLRLEKWIGSKVDLVTPDALHPALRERILKEAIYVR